MPAATQLYKMTAEYAKGRIQQDSFRRWFGEASLAGFFEDGSAAELANEIEGLMAEASHAGWTDSELQEELAAAIRPFERSSDGEQETPVFASPGAAH